MLSWDLILHTFCSFDKETEGSSKYIIGYIFRSFSSSLVGPNHEKRVENQAGPQALLESGPKLPIKAPETQYPAARAALIY